MPLYQVITQEGFLNDDQRAQLVTRITAIHVANTGAPELFANVLFLEYPSGRAFTAGEPSDLSILAGSIRRGRSIEIQQTMLTELEEMWCEITGQETRHVLLVLQEADPRKAREMGLFFPEAGQEAPWITQNEVRLKQLGLIT